MTRAFVAVGSNIAPARNVREALRRLALDETVARISTVYRAPAEGRPEQPKYYNCVVEIETATPPRDLKFRVLRRIENELGRERTADKCAARTIDLDLIWYGDLVMDADDLVLPDPQIARRPFLAVPLCQLAPDLVIPGSSLRICDAAAGLPRDGMEPLETYGDSLRKLLLRAGASKASRARSPQPRATKSGVRKRLRST
ncbi:MAG: 2-amino-4-hydroxy-6-hydroxymethyldihydropteridine diphosphokinase [Candidatus Brocadiia bacterium]